MKNSFYLGQFSKIKVFVHWTFLILIGYIVYSGISAGLTAEAIGWHVLFILAIFLCVVLHEFGHALMGKKFGFKTKNIILLPIGGVARFEKLPESPKQEFLVAIAGPMVNFFIALVLYVLLQPDLRYLLSLDLSSIDAANFFVLLCLVNFSLGLFNLIPAFPMDGGRIFRALLAMFLPREKATKFATAIGIVIAMGFIGVGAFYNPFLILIGAFIILAASSETSIVQAQALLKDHRVGEIVMHNYASLNENLTIADASKEVLDGQSTNFVITSNEGHFAGSIHRDQVIKSLNTMDHEHTLLAEIVTNKPQSIPAETPLRELYINPVLRNNAIIPVTEKGEVIGVINMENIIEFLAIKRATPLWKSLVQRKSV